MDNLKGQDLDAIPVLELVEKIRGGIVDPKLLFTSTRQMCVEALILEGCPTSSIASLFKVSERTIRRDVVELRKKNAIQASPEMTGALLGEFLANARNHSSHLKRIANLREAYPDEKARAAYLAWRVCLELIDQLSVVGFLSSSYSQGSGGNDDKEFEKNLARLSPKERDLMVSCRLLAPMEREKLLDRLRRDILDDAKREVEAAKEEGKNGNMGKQE